VIARGAFVVLAVLSTAGAACAAPHDAGRTPCPARVVIVGEDARPTCDVVPPTRLDVEMRRDAGARARCDQMGGTFAPAADPDAGEDVCIGVDY